MGISDGFQVFILCFLFQEYETARKELEGVKKERVEMKKKLKSLQEAQEPLLRKIRSVESQLQPIEQQMKELVSTNHKPDCQESLLYFLYCIKIMPLFFPPNFSDCRYQRRIAEM